MKKYLIILFQLTFLVSIVFSYTPSGKIYNNFTTNINNSSGIKSTINIKDDLEIKYLNVYVSVNCKNTENLIIYLTKDNTTVKLYNQTNRGQRSIKGWYSEELVPYQSLGNFSGFSSKGSWFLIVKDRKNSTENKLNDFKIEIISDTKAIGDVHPLSGPYSPVNEINWVNETFKLGANYNGNDLEFGVYSKNATKILLEIYQQKTGSDALYEYWMAKGTDNIYRAKLSAIPPTDTVIYAFRAWGPNWDFNSLWTRNNSLDGFVLDCDINGNRFNPNKVLIDPYAKEITHDYYGVDAVNAGGASQKYATGSLQIEGIQYRQYDTGRFAPKCYALKIDNTDYGVKPLTKMKDIIIYEVHVRGLTLNDPSVPAQYRGTYKGASYKASYLAELGITSVEFLPIHETDNEGNDINPYNPTGDNYWGYMTNNYFAPDRRYAYDKSANGPTKEFKEMVKAFHDAGIEVYIDVVYNHTAEGGVWWFNGTPNKSVADLKSYRGLDNITYYELSKDKQSYYDNTGIGANFNCANETVRQLVLASLKYYSDVMGVDGFRFDLAPVLGNSLQIQPDTGAGFVWSPEFPARIRTEIPVVKLIAEAWGIGDGSYLVGQFPSGWGDWNGRYRDAIRKFLNYRTDYSGDNFRTRIYGSQDYYDDAGIDGNGDPSKSVNFTGAHDGFPLADLVSYDEKSNAQAYPWGPSDGGESWNNSSNNNLDAAQRRRQIKNFFTIQMLSRGTPMFNGGDEFGRTQNGNNNTYNIDNPSMALHWNMIYFDNPQGNHIFQGMNNNLGTDTKIDGLNTIYTFTKEVIKLRKNHPCLRQDNYTDVIYTFKTNDWTDIAANNLNFAFTIDGSAINDDIFYAAINSSSTDVNFTIPTAIANHHWVRIIDTQYFYESLNDNIWPNGDTTLITSPYIVKPYSVLVLIAVPD